MSAKIGALHSPHPLPLLIWVQLDLLGTFTTTDANSEHLTKTIQEGYTLD